MKRRLLIHLFALSILIITSVRLFSTTQAQSNVIYVNVNATGFNDGTSWENAFLDLPLALASAQPGDEVWVAAGIYTPNILYPPAPTPTPLPGGPWNRAASIVLKNGVAIYGGFNGTESLLSERDWTTNLTVLSGDLNRDDGPDFTNNDENAYHVVTGGGTDATAILDGFTITGGNANGVLNPHNLGAGMYNNSSSPVLTNITFSGNTAQVSGGGMYSYDSSPVLTNVTFSGNTANYGGGMYKFSGSPVLTEVTFSSNTASSEGGGIWNAYDNPVLTDVTFSGNTASTNGGGMWNNSTSPMLTNVTFSGNTANYGGGMYNIYSSPMLTYITFSGNMATIGGGVFNDNSSLVLTNVTFSSNTASMDAGGMWNAYNDPVLTNVTFSGNTANRYGGGMRNVSGSPVLTNVIFSSNTANYGGGIHNTTGSPLLTNITFSGNTANGTGGGMWNSNGSPTLTNCILWGNTASSNPEIATASGSPIVSYSIVQGGYAGTGNLDADPLFIEPGGNLRLLPGSPAINAGDNSAVTVSTDLDGNPRLVGGSVDLGAYEYQGSNYPPVAVDDEITLISESIPVSVDVLTNDSDPDVGDTLFVESVSQPAFGDATINLDNSVTYTPNDFYGSDSFTYTISDGNGGTDTATVTIRPATRNDLWTSAYPLQFSSPAVIKQVLDRGYQSRWYKFNVVPGSEIIVTLTGLTADYDLAVYRDIGDAYRELNSTEDLVQLSAEFAPDMFSPDMFSPDMFSPDMFSPDMFSPDMFSPDMFSPDMFSPDMFSPDMFSPDMFSPDMFSPDMFSPDMFSPDMFSPDMFSPDMFSPDMFSPDMFSPDMFSPDLFASAQVRSMIAISASDGTTSEGIRANSWNESGEFYLRVTGKNGVFDPDGAYELEVTATSSVCGSIDPTLPNSDTQATSGYFSTIVLTDLNRMNFSDTQRTDLEDTIAAFINRTEVAGIWVDVGNDARVMAANELADANPGCPYAKNLVASAIKEIVDGYRAANADTLQYTVIIGNDDVIPFFRYPDNALLANEMDYFPPVGDGTPSQASLKLGYVLGQDEYGSKINLVQGSSIIPIPDLAVGRLVENPAEVITMLNAYSATQGVLAAPATGLVMGYDFLADAATAVENELQAGLGSTTAVNNLIAQSSVAPLDTCTPGQPFDGLCSWTAAQALAALLARDNDIIYLAGHFTANSMLAADNQTRLVTTDLADLDVNLENALILSAGCHSGYNIVDAHNVPGVTREPDWAQLFARKGATFIGGTGYQYGDTDFLEYSERLYLEFARKLRVGTGPVSLGKALVDAKLAYLANTATMSGIHEKALIEATFFGLPMLSMDLPAGRTTPEIDAPIVTELQPLTSGLGTELSSGFADITWSPSSPMVQTSVTLQGLELDGNGDPIDYPANYLSGEDGVVTNPNQPVLPLEMENVSVENTVLRGIGFRGGLYIDEENVLPLTGAAATDIRGVHVPFVSDFFFPVLPWSVNYIGELTGVEGGATRLAVMPAQFRSNSPVSIYGTLRQFADMQFRLFYSNNIDSYQHLDESGEPQYVYIPAQAAPPLISNITAKFDYSEAQINFEATVVGDPSAGIQEVWIVYTIENEPRSDEYSGEWKPVDLSKGKVDAQGNMDYRIWTGSLPLDPFILSDVRFMVVAVNGVGLVSYATNLGAYYMVFDPGASVPPEPAPTQITLLAPQFGAYGSEVTLSAIVTSGDMPVNGEVVVFRVGSQTRTMVSDASGYAEVTVSLLGLPGETKVSASLVGSEENAPSSTTMDFEIQKQDTQLTITPQTSPLYLGEAPMFIATLKEADGDLLSGKPVLFELKLAGNSVPVHSEVVATDYTGVARVILPLQWIGSYTLSAQFAGSGMEDLRFNASSIETPLDVDFVFTGFFKPVENQPLLNLVKAGSAIPIKFSLSGYQGLAILNEAPTVSEYACGTLLNLIDPAETILASESSLTYDATDDQYVYVWKTEKSWADTCRLLTVHLIDGTTHTLAFKFK